MHEALYYDKKEDGRVVCLLCPHHCHLADGQLGTCQARQNVRGGLMSLNYGECSGIALDPIEKKPLHRFHPGSTVLSVGSFGCNFRCSYCQNWSISQEKPETRTISPDELAELAIAYHKRYPACIGVAYTYSEPMIWYEFVLDCAKEVKRRGLANILVTNGYIETAPLRELLKYIDAINLDIKSYQDDFYHQVCGGALNTVLVNAELMAAACHLEVTTLLIPGHNDGAEEIKQLSQFLAQINRDIPLHLTRYFPNYQLNLPPTPRETMQQAARTARQYLNDVSLGNI
ncbi:MAG TPA: AmmeMemoRadiSam system radical SAM enzyme [Desulfobacteria bacterium]|nr:AmmeMemoRadiSam system radical SAM enzyme [Desulfobacteria bacterium]